MNRLDLLALTFVAPSHPCVGRIVVSDMNNVSFILAVAAGHYHDTEGETQNGR
jgi:hypothetical protein